MQIEIVDAHCPLCHSEKTRSKTHDGDCWWFICDNWDDAHIIVLNGVERSLRDEANAREESDPPPLVNRMFYFALDGRIDLPEGEQIRVVRQEPI